MTLLEQPVTMKEVDQIVGSWMGGIFFGIAGILLYLGSIHFAILEWSYARTGQSAQGTVTQVIEPQAVTRMAHRWLVFQFDDADGINHTGTTGLDMDEPCPRVDQTVTIQYIPGTDESRVLGQTYIRAVRFFVWFNIGIAGGLLLYWRSCRNATRVWETPLKPGIRRREFASIARYGRGGSRGS